MKSGIKNRQPQELLGGTCLFGAAGVFFEEAVVRSYK
jgi:hypothetical protein